MTSLGPITERRCVAPLTLVATLLFLHGSSVLVASNIGGAVGRAIMGFISDYSNIRVAVVVSLIRQACGMSFVQRVPRPVLAAQHPVPELSATP